MSRRSPIALAAPSNLWKPVDNVKGSEDSLPVT